MAGINEEVKITEGVFGGVSMGDNGAQESVLNAGSNLPAKTGFWSKVKSVLFYEIKVELTPYQQKVEDEIRSHPQEYAEANAVLEDKDKWTILRRLATIDPRLNIDRAYASETLRDIEDMIVSGEYRDLDAITDEMMITYMEIGRMNKTWDSDLHDFAKRNPAEDSKLYANEGFHGVRKAEERYEREKRRDLSGYAPMWQSPMWFDD